VFGSQTTTDQPISPDSSTGIPRIKEPVTPEQLRNLKITVSQGQTEAANIALTQSITLLAAGESIVSNLSSTKHESATLEALNTQDRIIGLGIGLILSTLFAFVWYIRRAFSKKNETLEETYKKYDTFKKQFNRWDRRGKAGVFFGNNLGQGIADVISQAFFFLMPNWLRMLLRTALGGLFGVICGLGAILFFHPESGRNSIFHMGRDGWSRYAKVGMVLGNFIGAAVGVFLTVSGGLTAGMLMGMAFGGVIGFVLVAIAVPLVNFILKKNKAPAPAPTPTNPSDVKPQPHLYRTNYIRTGILAGAALGIIIAFTIGYFVAPLALLTFVTVGAAIGATAGAIGFGVFGHAISKAISPVGDRAFSSWDYGARTGFTAGNQNGLGIAIFGILSLFGLDKCALCLRDLICSVFGLIGGTLAAVFDAHKARKLQSLDEKEFRKIKAENFIPWSQRVGTFITLGGFAGSVVGFIIGTLIGGPPGGMIGAMIGTGLGGLGGGGIAAKWGEKIYLKYAEFSTFLASKMTTMKKHIDDSLESIPPKVEISVKSPMQRMRRLLFTPAPIPAWKPKPHSTNGHFVAEKKPLLPLHKNGIVKNKSPLFFTRRTASQSDTLPIVQLDCRTEELKRLPKVGYSPTLITVGQS
jgi:hypothetical protein